MSLIFLPAAKRHGQGKVWVGIVLLLLWTIVSLVCFSFIFAMCVGILGQHRTVPKLSRSFTCNFYLQILLANFTCFSKFKKKFFIFLNFLNTLLRNYVFWGEMGPSGPTPTWKHLAPTIRGPVTCSGNNNKWLCQILVLRREILTGKTL